MAVPNRRLVLFGQIQIVVPNMNTNMSICRNANKNTNASDPVTWSALYCAVTLIKNSNPRAALVAVSTQCSIVLGRLSLVPFVGR